MYSFCDFIYVVQIDNHNEDNKLYNDISNILCFNRRSNKSKNDL